MNASLGRRALTFLLLALAATACSGDDADLPPPTSPATTTTIDATPSTLPEPDPATAITDYFDALATLTGDAPGAALAATVPGSPAADYATYLAAAEAVLDRGAIARADYALEAVTICRPSCTIYDDLQLGANGLLNSFDVNGQTIDDRVGLDGPAASSEGIRFQVRAAYLNASDHLFVVTEMSNRTDEVFQPFAFAASHRPADGSGRRDASDAFGPAEVQPGDTVAVLTVFEAGDLAGSLSLSGLLGEELAEVRVELTLPLAP